MSDTLATNDTVLVNGTVILNNTDAAGLTFLTTGGIPFTILINLGIAAVLLILVSFTCLKDSLFDVGDVSSKL
jgi:hypothetical protein